MCSWTLPEFSPATRIYRTDRLSSRKSNSPRLRLRQASRLFAESDRAWTEAVLSTNAPSNLLASLVFTDPQPQDPHA